MKHPKSCKADITKPGCLVYDGDCRACQAEYLEGQGLHVGAVALAVTHDAGPGAPMLAERFSPTP